MRYRTWVAVAAVVPLVTGLAVAASASTGARPAARASASGLKTGLARGVPFCKELGKKYEASSGANMFCFGSQPSGPAFPAGGGSHIGAALGGAPGNVDAASQLEDHNPTLAQFYGQSETSIAAAGSFVVEAWNDSTGFGSNCGARMNKEELTGLAFSNNGGHSFTDLGGLFNPGCRDTRYGGDPSVAAYVVHGHTYFYIASLFNRIRGLGLSYIAFDPCQVLGSGPSATLHCDRPVIAASSKQCLKFSFGGFCSFLDKDFLAIDPARGRLYVDYSEFPLVGNGNPIDMSVCDLGTRTGGAGPAGGTPGNPVCKRGTPLAFAGHLFGGRFFTAKPYFTVAKPGFRGCENEGAYPAVNLATGSVYVGYEFNWATNIFSPNCFGFKAKTKDVITRTPHGCLTLTAVASCSHPANTASVAVFSMDAGIIPGYSRFPLSDFPRLAVSSRFGDVSMVWNDARHHALGDILLQSFKLSSLKRVQRFPTTLDAPHGGGVTFLPGLRVANADGLLDVVWYSRASAGTANTSVVAAMGVSPAATSTPGNRYITNRTSNWLTSVSDINPNFGDYTDAVLSATGSWPFVGSTLYVAWSDGRLGVTQPFEAHLSSG
jgi:hypothetical protein